MEKKADTARRQHAVPGTVQEQFTNQINADVCVDKQISTQLELIFFCTSESEKPDHSRSEKVCGGGLRGEGREWTCSFIKCLWIEQLAEAGLCKYSQFTSTADLTVNTLFCLHNEDSL